MKNLPKKVDLVKEKCFFGLYGTLLKNMWTNWNQMDFWEQKKENVPNVGHSQQEKMRRAGQKPEETDNWQVVRIGMTSYGT